MSCALAASLLPGSHAWSAVMCRKQGFRAGDGRRGHPRDMPVCGVRKCGMRGRQGSVRGQGCIDPVPCAAGEPRRSVESCCSIRTTRSTVLKEPLGATPAQVPTREKESCLLVLNLVSSTLPCIRQPGLRLRVLDVCGFV
jgi:hypothetical protein